MLKAETTPMTVHVQIQPEVETRLLARARSTGESLELFIQRLLEREASSSAGLAAAATTDRNGSQRAEAFRAWAKSFSANMPQLALEDISRDKLYERD